MVLLTILFLALLFVVGLINVFFYLPINKFCAWVQSFFPKDSSADNSTISSSPTLKQKEKSVYQKDELKKVFSTFDKNGDGFITRQELRESLRNLRISMTDREIEDIVVKFDSNGDGLIDFDEFCLLTSECMVGQEGGSEGILKEDEEENLKEAFDVFDKDKDGLISVEELALVLNTLGLKEGRKIEDCIEMIRKVDMDGDGKVNFNEFKRMMKNGGSLVLPA
ncbi:hypothetical protein L6164_011430 [Bauhinia variegata]|uniref:Uncharacterized protein n=1 Tax=Bauhinia variegata TaxID=167791 RepID=A0ACB9P5Z8_BAUVA|nr:hypothetical protein L6164_011430 [Bauhinia variegata]